MTMKKQKFDLDLSEVNRYIPDYFNLLVVKGNCFNFDKKFLTAQEKLNSNAQKLRLTI